MKKLVLATVGVALVAVLAAALGSAKTSGPTQAKATKLPPLPADIKSRNRFIIGVKCDVPPFGYIDVQGKNQGFDVEIGRWFARYAFGRAQRVTGDDDLLARRLVDVHRLDWIGDRVRPRGLDLRRRPSHADRIDTGRSGKRAHHHRHVVSAAGAVGYVGEQEGAALILAKTALELPAHQRMQLGVLVDRAVDAHQEALRLEQREMLLEVLRRCVRRGLVGDIEHGWSSNSFATYDL